jgi:hypothetical protein
VLKYLEISGNIWKYLEISGNVLKYLETLFFRKISKDFREKNAAKFAT